MDIVERLRRGVDTNEPPDKTDRVMSEAADAIERLRCKNEWLLETGMAQMQQARADLAVKDAELESAWADIRKMLAEREDWLEEIEQLRALVTTLADDLEDELTGHYAGVIEHPAMKERFERDMVNVYKARRALDLKSTPRSEASAAKRVEGQ
jgi:hypothetical protein